MSWQQLKRYCNPSSCGHSSSYEPSLSRRAHPHNTSDDVLPYMVAGNDAGSLSLKVASPLQVAEGPAFALQGTPAATARSASRRASCHRRSGCARRRARPAAAAACALPGSRCPPPWPDSGGAASASPAAAPASRRWCNMMNQICFQIFVKIYQLRVVCYIDCISTFYLFAGSYF